MGPSAVVALAGEIERRVSGKAPNDWGSTHWDEQLSELLLLIAAEVSALRLGDILRLDAALEMPVNVVRSCYLRLFELGVSDVHTRLCYARYLLLHGPGWDGEAQDILGEIEEVAREAGLWDSRFLGHHPVFFAGPE